MENKNIDDLTQLAKMVRKEVLHMCYHAKGGHVAPSFSCVEILVSLYYKILDIDKNNFENDDRDRFVLSKGHAGAALYAILADKQIIDKKLLSTFCKKDSILGAHPEAHIIPGIDFSTGSLGHGLSIGAGVSLAAKIDKQNYKSFVLLSDGECQEGSTWEAALFAAHHKLDNIVAIVDYNNVQALGFVDEILDLNPLKDKWQSFGWEVKEVDGHNISQIVKALENLPFISGKPSVLLAHTVKGKGVSFMENSPIWHYRIPSNKEEWEIACKELDIDTNVFSEVFK